MNCVDAHICESYSHTIFRGLLDLLDSFSFFMDPKSVVTELVNTGELFSSTGKPLGITLKKGASGTDDAAIVSISIV